MKLKEFNFNSIMSNVLVIKEEGKLCTDKDGFYEGFIGEVLKAIPIEWAEREIKETRWFFDEFVIELKQGDTI